MTSATPNSGSRSAPGFDQSITGCVLRKRQWVLGVVSYPLLAATYLFLLSWFSTISAGAVEKDISSITEATSPVDLARKALREATARYEREPQSLEAAWKLGRACFDLAEEALPKAERARLAERGIEVCKKAVALDDQSAPAYYYLGMNLGQLARTKGLGALKIVGQLKSAFERARELDERQEYAGPDRNLGLLFRDAPSWTVGDRPKAQVHLAKAVALAPEYPDNRLELIEGYFKWGDRISAQAEIETLEKMWTKLRQQFTGPKWERQWADWQARLESFQKKIEKTRKKQS